MWIVHSTNNNNLKASSEFISLLRGPHSGVSGGAGAVPGEVADVDQGGGRLLPADCALAVAVDHVLEDPGEPPCGVPLGGQLGQLALQPDLADVGGEAEVGVGEAVVTGDGLVYPAGGLAHVSIDPGGSVLPAANAPGHNAGLDCPRLSWQVSWSTTGRSISFRTTWYSPAAPNLSLPHPVAKQEVPLNVSPASGRQTVSMWSASSNSWLVKRTAKSFWRLRGSNSGWMSRSATCLSWWGRGSVWCWVSHSPQRTFSSVGFCLNLSTQWAAVRTTPGAMRDPPHW